MTDNIVFDAHTNKAVFIQLEQHICQIKLRRSLQTFLDEVVNGAGSDFVIFVVRGIVFRPIQD